MLAAIAAAGALVLVLALGVGRGTDPGRLAVGDCFDVPATSDRIGDVGRLPCGSPHDGEVFHVHDTAGSTSGYPTDPAWESLIHPICDPVFESYTGTPVGDRLDIDYRYLVPTADRWASGDRGVTCFITSPDGSPLGKSFRFTP